MRQLDPAPAFLCCPTQDYGVQRLRNTEFVLPIVVGTIAFSLGKKVSRGTGMSRALQWVEPDITELHLRRPPSSNHIDGLCM
jgi:hypothetical protein